MKMKKLVIVLMLIFSTIAYSTTKAFSRISYTILHSRFDEGVKIKLVLGNKTYYLQNYSIIYSRIDKTKNDATSSNVFGGTYPYQKSNISVNLRSSKIDQELLDWILSAEQQTKDGQIIVTDGESGKTLKTITFTGANTAIYNENNNINNFGGNIQYTNFTLYYKTISIKY